MISHHSRRSAEHEFCAMVSKRFDLRRACSIVPPSTLPCHLRAGQACCGKVSSYDRIRVRAEQVSIGEGPLRCSSAKLLQLVIYVFDGFPAGLNHHLVPTCSNELRNPCALWLIFTLTAHGFPRFRLHIKPFQYGSHSLCIQMSPLMQLWR